jgi:hypothetical protein
MDIGLQDICVLVGIDWAVIVDWLSTVADHAGVHSSAKLGKNNRKRVPVPVDNSKELPHRSLNDCLLSSVPSEYFTVNYYISYIDCSSAVYG